MSDIVDRLRERVDSTEPGDTYAFGIEVAMLGEAADEIERLRAVIVKKDEAIEWLKPFAASGLCLDPEDDVGASSSAS